MPHWCEFLQSPGGQESATHDPGSAKLDMRTLHYCAGRRALAYVTDDDLSQLKKIAYGDKNTSSFPLASHMFGCEKLCGGTKLTVTQLFSRSRLQALYRLSFLRERYLLWYNMSH